MVVISRRGNSFNENDHHDYQLPLCRTPTGTYTKSLTKKQRPTFRFGMSSPRNIFQTSPSSSSIHSDSRLSTHRFWSSSTWAESKRQDQQQSPNNTTNHTVYKTQNVNRVIQSMYGISILSWVLIRVLLTKDTTMVIASIDHNTRIITAQMAQLVNELQIVDTKLKNDKQIYKNLQKTRKALNHEITIYQKVEHVTGQAMNPTPRSGNEALIKNWLSHRTDGLLSKIYKLQHHLQQASKKVVLERYGDGPYRVEFTVDLIQNDGKRTLKSFVVETTTVDTMPISINLFLDMISAGIWDNTVFLHHEEIEHIIAAAPVDYTTEKVRTNQLHQLGWIGLGYPEYSEDYPHTQYTLAFAGLGPTFYINTVDNTVAHGPGTQQHHILHTDADSCFAKIVDGFDVFDELIVLGMKQQPKKTFTKVAHEWADAAHAWTHIVSAKIIPYQ